MKLSTVKTTSLPLVFVIILIISANITQSIQAENLVASPYPLYFPIIATPNTVDHVFHISIDGLNATKLKALIDNDSVTSPLYPTFKKLMDEGAYTFNARTDYYSTNTTPNHTSMLTARPVLEPSGMTNTVPHGYVSNSSPSATETIHNTGNPNLAYIPSVFDIVHDAGKSTALFASKEKFILFDQSYDSLNGAVDTTGDMDNGKDKIDTYVNIRSGSPYNAMQMHSQLLTFLSNNPTSIPNYTFIHYRDPDSAGHVTSWGSIDWNLAVAQTDAYLNDLITLITNNSNTASSTIIIVTSDHGGGNPADSHGIASEPTNYTIPLFVWGTNVAQNQELYTINPLRTDPGTSRPTYSVPMQPIRNGETGTLALSLLGLSPINNTLMNTPMNVFP